MRDELIKVATELNCEYEETDEAFVIKFKNFKDNFQIICKEKEKRTIAIKTKNGKLLERKSFYNFENLKSYICCQYILECFQNA